MPQGGGGGASREHQRKPLPISSSDADLPPTHSLINSLADSARGRTLTYDDLARCFHLPINAAAKELGVCVTALKKQCRKHGVPRWPHRKLKSLDKLKEKLEKEEATAADKEYYKHELISITQKKDHIFRSSSGNTSNPAGMSSAPGMSHLTAQTADTALHPRPGQLVMGRPVSHFHSGPPVYQKGTSPQVTAHYANSQTRSPGPPSGMESEQQQQQHIIAGPLIMPFTQMSGTTTSMAGPNGTLIPQPAPGAQQYSLCGIFGCDCYMNNGVSSRMYHPPITAMRHPGAPSHAASNNMNGGAVPAGLHYFNPTAYAYAPAMAQMAPYQNMVQFNVVEQTTFPHGARQPQQPTVPTNNSMVNSTGSQSQAMMHHPAKGATGNHPPGAFDMYGNVSHAPNGTGGFVCNTFMPQNVHYESMMAHQGNATTVPAYWSDVQHQQTPGNMVTMCNQTVHHHHHHGTETVVTSPSLVAQANAARKQGFDNTSSKTNNSDARALVNLSAAKEKNSKDTLVSVDMENGDAQEEQTEPANNESAEGKDSRKQPLRKSADSDPLGGKISVVSANASSIPEGKQSTLNQVEEQRASQNLNTNDRSCSSQTQSDSKCAGDGPIPNGAHKNSKPNGIRVIAEQEPSGTSSYSGTSNDVKRAHNDEIRRPSKRARTHLAPVRQAASITQSRPENGRTSNRSIPNMNEAKVTQSDHQMNSSRNHAGHLEAIREKNKHSRDLQKSRDSSRKWISSNPNGVESNLPNVKPPNTLSTVRKDGQGPQYNNNPSTTASLVNRARRYDHVVHQCLGLQSAQWCTDMNFKITLALGPKAMLGLAGVPSLGKSVLEGTDIALESRSTTKNKYSAVAKGQRLEWITTNGSNRYLIVMNPYRKRSQAEISGVSGIMIELKIIRALPK